MKHSPPISLVLVFRLIILAFSVLALLIVLIVLFLTIRTAKPKPEVTTQPVIGIDQTNFQKALEKSNQ